MAQQHGGAAVPVTQADIRAAAFALGLSHRPVCVHSSLRSFGLVDGGASTILAGLLLEGCTVLVPTFSNFLATAPPAGRHLERNAWSGDEPLLPRSLGAYRPEMNDVEKGMGAVPAALLAASGRWRGAHPLNSFAAVGPLAEAMTRDQTPLHVYAPLEALLDAGGAVALMGVDLRRLTLLHLAEQRAGRTLFRRWATGADGQTVEASIGSCSEGFERLWPILAPIAREATVGASRWRVLPAGETVDRVAAAIRADPTVTHCPDPGCARCNDAEAGGPVLTAG